MFTSPGNIAFSFGLVEVHWYGIIMSLSILFGIIVIFSVAKKYFKDVSSDIICDISFYLELFLLGFTM